MSAINGLTIVTPSEKESDHFLVPGSGSLFFNFNSKKEERDAWFHQQTPNLLLKEFKITIDNRVIIHDTSSETVLGVYGDLWKEEGGRNKTIKFGLSNKNLRGEEIVSPYVPCLSSFSMFGIRQDPSELSQYSDKVIGNNPRYLITFPEANNFVVDPKKVSVEEYCLQYGNINYKPTVNSISPACGGREIKNALLSPGLICRRLLYDHVVSIRLDGWDSDSTSYVETFSISSKNKAVVLLFLREGDVIDFIYPNIIMAELTVEGAGKSTVFGKDEMFNNARQMFGKSHNMNFLRFFSNEFALVFNLSSFKREFDRLDIKMELTKKKSPDVKCIMFAVSDAFLTNLPTDGPLW